MLTSFIPDVAEATTMLNFTFNDSPLGFTAQHLVSVHLVLLVGSHHSEGNAFLDTPASSFITNHCTTQIGRLYNGGNNMINQTFIKFHAKSKTFCAHKDSFLSVCRPWSNLLTLVCFCSRLLQTSMAASLHDNTPRDQPEVLLLFTPTSGWGCYPDLC